MLIMCETSLNSGNESPGQENGLTSAGSFAIDPNIKIKMGT